MEHINKLVIPGLQNRENLEDLSHTQTKTPDHPSHSNEKDQGYHDDAPT
jgi:hypothetical protein